ncbi:hypothetical protein IF650_02145 [Cellulosimicrobium terreum]|nr:hypothetical protein [Cellulosimicrobium terreum]
MSTADDAAAIVTRRRDLRRVRVAEVVLVLLQLVAVVLLMLRLPAQPAPDDLTAAIYGVMVSLGLQVMVSVRLLWILVMGPGSRRVRRKVPARVGFVTAASPVLTLLVLVPWIVSGIFDGGEGASAWLLFLLLVLAAGFGLLATAVVLAPVEMAVRGVVAVVRGSGDRGRRADGWALLRGAAWLGALGLFVVGVGLAVDQPGPGRGSWGVVVLAVVGLPGDYTVRYPVLLWAGRAVLLALVVSVVVPWARKRVARARPAREQGDEG